METATMASQTDRLHRIIAGSRSGYQRAMERMVKATDQACQASMSSTTCANCESKRTCACIKATR